MGDPLRGNLTLVDANVLSEPTKKEPDDQVVQWLRRNEREIAVDP